MAREAVVGVKRRVGICPVCRCQVGVSTRGLVVTHRGNFPVDRKGCPGSGQPEYKEQGES